MMDGGINGLQRMCDEFEALKDDPPAMWAYYNALSNDLKFVLWRHFPVFHELLRAEEKKELL
jgi:hypothetical protein